MSPLPDPSSGRPDPAPLPEKRGKFQRNAKPPSGADAKPGEAPAADAPPPAESHDASATPVGAEPPRPKRFHKSRPPGEEILTGPAELPEYESTWKSPANAGRPLPWGWFGLVGAILIGGMAWSVHHVHKAQPHLEAIQQEVEGTLVSEERMAREAREILADIERAVRAFASASDIDSLLAVSRHPQRVRPLMMDHYARHPLKPLGRVEMHGMQPITLGNHGGFWVVPVILDDGERKSLLVEAALGREARVDWETAVVYQPMDWDDFVRNRPEGVFLDFRVRMQPDNHFSHEFADEKVWDCFKLTAPGSEEHLFGYVRSDSPTAAMIRTWYENYPDESTTMILCLTFPPGIASPNGVMIDHAKSARWVYVVPPYAE